MTALVAFAAMVSGTAVAWSAPAAALRIACSVDQGWISASASLLPGEALEAQRAEVLQALGRGLRSGMEIQFRLYEPASGIAGLLGDRLLRELTVDRTVSFDPFERLYVLEEAVDAKPRETFMAASTADLLDAFFDMKFDRLMVAPQELDENAYLQARYRLSPVRLAGALGVLSLLFDAGSRVGAWTRSPVLGGQP